MTLAETILLRLCRSAAVNDYHSEPWQPGDPLSLARRTLPRFADYVRDKDVVDFGCGYGRQSVALLREGARSVFGVEIEPVKLAHAHAHAKEMGVGDRIRFGDVEAAGAEAFDVVLSQNAFEHFADPRAVLAQMVRLLRRGGRVLLTFGPPWLAPYGAHMHFFCRVPWVHLLFSERTVMRVRSRFRTDVSSSYADAGLNRMTIRRFERLVRESGLHVEYRRYYCLKNLKPLAAMPLVRELAINHVAAVLVRT